MVQDLAKQDIPPWVAASQNNRFNDLERMLAVSGPDITQTNKAESYFVPGFYIRQILLPKDSIWTTKIHKTEHPFVISKGKVAVWSQEMGTHTLTGYCTGITKAGTRRVIYIIEETLWTTFHATEETDLKKIEELLIYPHDIPQALTG